MVVAGALGWRQGKADVRADVSRRKTCGGREKEKQQTKDRKHSQKESNADAVKHRMSFKQLLSCTVRTANEEYFLDGESLTFQCQLF